MKWGATRGAPVRFQREQELRLRPPLLNTDRNPGCRHRRKCRNLNNSELQGSLTLTFDHEPSLAEIEEKYLQMLLTKYSGHRLMIAKRLGVSERNIYRMIDKHGLKADACQSEE